MSTNGGGMSRPAAAAAAATFCVWGIFLLVSGLMCIVVLLKCNLIVIVGLLVVVGVAVAAARATMVAWITVLVLLAFAGNRRRVLAKQGRKITADVAMYLAGVVVNQRGFVAVAFAAVFSLLAVVRSTEISQFSVS